MSELPALVPPSLKAAGSRRKFFPFAFGPRFFLLLLIGMAWLGPAFFHVQFLYAMLAWDLILLIFWAVDLARLPCPALLSVTRSWNAAPSLSVAARIDLILHNGSQSPLRAVLVDDVSSNLRAEIPELELLISPGGTASAGYEVMPAKRGEAILGSVFMRYQSPFRIAERWAAADLLQKIYIHPNLEEARQHTVYMIRSRQIEMEKRHARSRGLGREFESLREYRDGDEFRSICWRATARRGKLISRVFQAERSQTIWLVLDSGRLMRARISGLSKLDYAVNAALSLCQVALGSGDRVGLLAYGRTIRHFLLPNRGSAHLRKIIQELTVVDEEPGEADHSQAASVLLSRQSRRSLVVWITDLAETAMTPEVIDAAGQMLSRHLVIFVVIGQPDLGQLAAKEPHNASAMYLAAASQEMIHRRELLLARLRQRGALAVEVTSGNVSTAVVNRYLEVKERNLI